MKGQHCIPTIGSPTLPRDAIAAARRRFDARWPGALLRRAVDQLGVWYERARQRRRLRQLDDHLRHDLGLTQAAIDAEAAKPFWRP